MISFRATVEGRLKDHAVAVFNVLTLIDEAIVQPVHGLNSRLRSLITDVAVSVAVRDAKEEPPEPGRPL
jgi:hypothetical protein